MEKGKVKREGRVALNAQNEMLLPHNPKVEEAVLGAMLIDANAYERISDVVTEQMFFEKDNRLVFKAISELGREGTGIDMMTVSDRLNRLGELKYAEAKVIDLATKIHSSAHISSHAKMLRELYMYREIGSYCAMAESEALERKLPVSELLQKVEAGIYNLSISQDRQKIAGMKEMLYTTAKEIEAACNRHGMSGLESGFGVLDQMTSGWQKSDLIILAARPAMGKTALLLNMAKHMAEQKHPVLIFSLEMSKSQLTQRLLVNATELEANQLKRGHLTDADWTIFNHQISLLEKLPIYIDDSANLSIVEMATKARRMVKEGGIECIFIDYLQLIHADGKTINNREQEVSTISRALKQLAKELNIPVIALSQLNRGVESRSGENKRPMLSDLRESGAIEQDADLVLLLHRPEYYHIIMDADGNSTKGVAELIIAKNRNGATGTIKLHFDAEIIKFQ